ncbi:MAG TPA: alpha/beta fold hydrolase [Patescibacteria group bacterium]|nr:alpha/beta fold hydrolase [Patescibacteria group bacterium]
MNVDFVRFKASDNVELRGWFSDGGSDKAVIHVHGMSGNGYENYFLDNLREMYNSNGFAFFSIDTRGSGIYNSFFLGGDQSKWGEGTKPGGSCFEIFEESVNDIQGAIDYLKTLGKTKFILQGHSLGGSKVVNYIVNKGNPEVIASILLAPTDMSGWAATDPNHKKYLLKAKKLIAENKGKELVSAECWLDKTPLSAQTYPTICEAGRAVDIYGNKGIAPLGKVKIPNLIVYGDNDIGILKIDGSTAKWKDRVGKIKHKNTQISVISGASHSFKGYEEKLSQIIQKYLKGTNKS